MINIAKNLVVEKEFDAELSLVWDAFSKKEILDQWWTPKPCESKTKVLDFKVGGRRFYAMVTAEGQERWSVQKYFSISPKTNFKYFNAFADKDENLELPGSDWDFTFSEPNGSPEGRVGQRITKVIITIYNESIAPLEKMIEMGFKGGFTITLNELATLLQEEKI